MRVKLVPVFCALALFSACSPRSVAGYWKDGVPDVREDMGKVRSSFREFASLASKSGPDEASAELGRLLDALSRDTVAYYVYTDLAASAFYPLESPFRSDTLMGTLAGRLTTDWVLTPSDAAPYLEMYAFTLLNRKGAPARLPHLRTLEGRPLTISGEDAVVAVIDLSCPQCRDALQRCPARPSERKIAVCMGSGPGPELPDWEVCIPEADAHEIFDIAQTPFYFRTGGDGTVSQTYTSL